MAYALAHKGKATALEVTYNPADRPEAYTNVSVHSKLSEYTSVARQRHREDFDPATQPLDTDLLMRLGGGKQHDRY
jgi:F0F1-type ATP synthase beta subunit